MIRQLSKKGLLKEIKKIDIDKEAINIFDKKSIYLFLKIENISIAFANIIKQASISFGADFAVHRDTITGKIEKTDGIWFGNKRHLEKLIRYLKEQPWKGLQKIGEELKKYTKRKEKEIYIGRKKIISPVIMTILNTTPDSFYDGGKYNNIDRAIKRIEETIEYTDILDIGGESTRPGAEPVDKETELRRTIPFIKEIKKKFPKIIISIDTYKPSIARQAIEEGAEIVNDISGLSIQDKMIEVLSEYKDKISYVLMHIKGTPKNMQKNPFYENVVKEIYSFLKEKSSLLEEKGIKNIIIDPGIGFGKRVKDNLEIISRLEEFKEIGYPLLIGISRKSFIGFTLNIDVGKRLIPSIGVAIYSFLKGADIIRTHDPEQTFRTLSLIKEIENV